MMYPVFKENCREEQGEEGFNLPTDMKWKTKVNLYAIFLLTLSPLISFLSRCGSRNFKRGWGVKGVDVEMNNFHIHVYKKIKHV